MALKPVEKRPGPGNRPPILYVTDIVALNDQDHDCVAGLSHHKAVSGNDHQGHELDMAVTIQAATLVLEN